jgi:hypothetical protein
MIFSADVSAFVVLIGLIGCGSATGDSYTMGLVSTAHASDASNIGRPGFTSLS